MASVEAEIGIIGGSGLYSFAEEAEPVNVSTPYGPPTAAIMVGTVSGRRVAFVARHGARHEYPPHLVNYRANLWAFRSLGVRQVLAPYAVGSLRPDLPAGTIVVPDQLVDRTWGRAHTLFDQVAAVAHVSFADPYCPRGRNALLQADATLTDGGTLVVVNGPRFSSRAESVWHAAQGWSLVGMTAQPEAALARELAVCYTGLAVVTDLDAGVEGGSAVSHSEVLAIFEANLTRVKQLLRDAVALLPPAESDEDATCSCRHALDGLPLPFELP
jgi:5'-methylthioadenosine phosphorylase